MVARGHQIVTEPEPKIDIVPPLKWAGGKRWLVQQYADLFPNDYGSYFEPFAGGAAVFFHLRPRSAFLSDKNQELIETYIALRDEGPKVFRILKQHQKLHSESHYYEVRGSSPSSIAGRAARFIYLNRTCFNGLYRVNRFGQFNVPKGSKDNVILESDNFVTLASILQRATITSLDFETVIDGARKNDLVFADPPYTVAHSKNGFIKYNEVLFSWQDQVRLAECLARAKKRGVKVVATNADHPSIRSLYRGIFRIRRLARKSMISGNPSHRKSVDELLISSQ